MPNYLCKIGTADGRVVEKDFDALNPGALRESLEAQGFHVFSVRRRFWQGISSGSGSGRFSGRRFLSFNQELVVLLRSGLPILQVLDTITDRLESGPLLTVLRDIRESIKGGSALSEAFSNFPKFFPPLYVASLRAGERTGDLAVTIGRYIVYQQRAEKLREKIRSASFYPMLLTGFVIIVLLIMLIYVVPRFTQIYVDANVELPIATRIVIWVANSLIAGLPVLIPAIIIGGALLRSFLRTMRGRLLLDRFRLMLPFFGRLSADYSLSGFCRTLGTTLQSGIPIVPALQMSRGTLNNSVFEEKMLLAIQRVEEGTSLSEAFDQSSFFPGIALRMIGVGETSGALPDMLGDVADYYEDEVARRLDRLSTMIEPVIMLVMGLLIAMIVVAMYLPIFQLGATIS
jgi:type IV pilus assembly protein PilC